MNVQIVNFWLASSQSNFYFKFFSKDIGIGNLMHMNKMTSFLLLRHILDKILAVRFCFIFQTT